MKRIILIMIVFGGGLLFSNCTKKEKPNKRRDTVTSGKIHISIDESLRPLFESEIDTFMGTYPDAIIEATYTSEDSAVQSLLTDSSRLAIITRKLTADEQDFIKKSKQLFYQTAVAKEAVAVIVHKDNKDSIFSKADLKAIVEGRMTSWKQINPKSPLDKIEVVLDNPGSGIVRFLKDSIANVAKLPPNFYGASSNRGVIDYVSKKPNAIGLIGVSWISDNDDPKTREFLNLVTVAPISKDSTAVKPHQAYVADHEYPLRRVIYMISLESKAALGSGFTAFVSGQKGQLIILKSGMVPATVPLRLVEFNKNKIE